MPRSERCWPFALPFQHQSRGSLVPFRDQDIMNTIVASLRRRLTAIKNGVQDDGYGDHRSLRNELDCRVLPWVQHYEALGAIELLTNEEQRGLDEMRQLAKNAEALLLKEGQPSDTNRTA